VNRAATAGSASAGCAYWSYCTGQLRPSRLTPPPALGRAEGDVPPLHVVDRVETLGCFEEDDCVAADDVEMTDIAVLVIDNDHHMDKGNWCI
jgi:hypothetical protein